MVYNTLKHAEVVFEALSKKRVLDNDDWIDLGDLSIALTQWTRNPKLRASFKLMTKASVDKDPKALARAFDMLTPSAFFTIRDLKPPWKTRRVTEDLVTYSVGNTVVLGITRRGYSFGSKWGVQLHDLNNAVLDMKTAKNLLVGSSLRATTPQIGGMVGVIIYAYSKPLGHILSNLLTILRVANYVSAEIKKRS